MNNGDKFKWVLASFLILSFICALASGGNMVFQNKIIARAFANELNEQGYAVKNGSVKSPIAIFDVGYNEFMEVVKESPIIVLDSFYLYAFSPDYIWGYKYEVIVKPNHPISWIYPIGEWHHDKS